MNSRDEFEKFLASNHLCADKTFNDWSGKWIYNHTHIDAMWVGWGGAMDFQNKLAQENFSQFCSNMAERYRIAALNHSIKPR